MNAIHKILFVRTDRIGDVLMNLPAIRTIRQNFPKAWIALLTTQTMAELLKGHPDLDEIIVLGSSSDRQIPRVKFDMVIISNPSKQAHIRYWLAGIPVRVGYNKKWGFLLTHRLSLGAARLSRHEIDNNLELISLVARRHWDGNFFIPGDMPDKPLPCEPIIAVHIGTTNPAKRWPLERFAALMTQLHGSMKVSIVLIGGPEEKSSAEKLQRLVSGPVTNWVGELSLREVAGFFRSKKALCLVSSDSGPVHLAWMSGTPVVALYSQNDPGSNPTRWGARDSGSVLIHKPILEISVEEVLQAVQKLGEHA